MAFQHRDGIALIERADESAEPLSHFLTWPETTSSGSARHRVDRADSTRIHRLGGHKPCVQHRIKVQRVSARSSTTPPFPSPRRSWRGRHRTCRHEMLDSAFSGM